MVGFKVRCIKTKDSCYLLNKIYEVDEHGRIYNEDGCCFSDNNMESFEKWHEDCNWVDYDFELVAEEFTKADLKTGMRVVLRNGHRYIYIDSSIKGFVFESQSLYLSEYDENLKYKNKYACPNLDIVKVYKEPNMLIDMLDIECETPVIWHRPEPRKMTKEEAEKYISEQLDEKVVIEG